MRPFKHQSTPARRRGSARTFTLLAIGVLLGMVADAAWERFARGDAERQEDEFEQALELVEETFVQPRSRDRLLGGALRGIVGELDPYSRFYDRTETSRLERETTGRYDGIGVLFAPVEERWRILFPLPGSPAAEAGLRVGDRLMTVAGEDSEGLEFDALRALLGDGGAGPVALEIEGLDGSRRSVEVTPSRVVDPSIRRMAVLEHANNKVGYLSIGSFTRLTATEFVECVRDLRSRGAASLVIDLRGNLGGVLDSALAIADEFVSDGALLRTESREGTDVAWARPEPTRLAGFPTVVLIDGESASASEVLAGALQDHRQAVLVGEPSYGKGTVQTLTTLDELQGVLRVTTSVYRTPSGRLIERSLGNAWDAGLSPDLVVAIDEGARAQLRAYLGTFGPRLEHQTAVPLGTRPRRPSWSARTRTTHSSRPLWSCSPVGDRWASPAPRRRSRRAEVPVTLLGIESSCDDTAAAVVVDGRRVLSSVVRSQTTEHLEWGGVVPEIAGRSHLDHVVGVVDRALDEAGLGLDDLDGIAVTVQPGLIGSLLVGLSAAKGLAWGAGLPLVGVHHIEAHAYAGTMELEEDPYPCIALVVSGGHTALYRMEGHGRMEPLARTFDDAAGEAFDKVAHLLGLPYPGGPSIAALAEEGDPSAIRFPRYRAKPERPGFSFSGLKTAVLYHLRGQDALAPTPPPEEIPDRADVAASFQAAAVDALVRPALEVAEAQGVRSVLVVGGVARNERLRAEFARRGAERGIRGIFPAPTYCTDNAAMVAGLGHHLLAARGPLGRSAELSLDASPR
ncbi:MAG: tRNA (adenosine(37)-N6)-threonylcarbamoyltransferase complex transferase subunit TsaD [Planctomycetota bacterium]